MNFFPIRPSDVRLFLAVDEMAVVTPFSMLCTEYWITWKIKTWKIDPPVFHV